MKREPQLAPDQAVDQAPEQESQEVAAPAEADETAAEVYSAEGETPAVVAAPEGEAEVAAAAPTASEQAFADPAADAQKSEQEMIDSAEDFNEVHHSWADEFNHLTDGSCLTHGKLDPVKIRDFQKAHIHVTLVADGRVGPWTIAAAKRVAEIREKEKSDAEAAAAPAKENKAAPIAEVIEEKPATEAVAKAEVAPEVVGDEKVAAEVQAAPEVEVAEAGAETEVKTEEIDTESATRYNLNHSSNVSEFNELTNYANTSGGELDIEKVVAFQKAHGVVADGCIGFQTLHAAKEAAEPVAAVQVPDVVEEQAPAMA